jgi:hypothetical protein
MRHTRGIIPLAAMMALLLSAGCETVGHVLLSAILDTVGGANQTTTRSDDEDMGNAIESALGHAAAEVIQTATSQAAEQTVKTIVAGLQQLANQNGSNSTHR